MNKDWIYWAAPPALILSVAAPAYAVQYMTIEQAQQAAFPAATHFTEAHIVFTPEMKAKIEQLSGQKLQTKGEQVWQAKAGNKRLGYFILDYVIGKHLVIDYSVALETDGRIRQVDILQYRESYGGEITNPDWLAQFKGKTGHDNLEPGQDIRIISGATLSSRHVTEGIKKVLAIYDICIR
jgi:Na+-transporting NADH:ubiquinone oxidoreductase subunit NqrC